jgi:hypothetical protein
MTSSWSSFWCCGEEPECGCRVGENKIIYRLIELSALIGCAKSSTWKYFGLRFLQTKTTTTKSTTMARRRTKKRTHVGAKNVPASQASRAPKSMVIRIGAGDVGPSVSQLVKDVRLMMEPGTAARLKERRANRLRDYLTMAGPLGVSHLMLFSRSESGNTNMRLAITPRGPTLHFHVEKYSLCKDVRKSMKHPRGGGKEYLTSPLVWIPTPSSRNLLISVARHEQFQLSSLG